MASRLDHHANVCEHESRLENESGNVDESRNRPDARLRVHQLTGGREDIVKHRFGQSACERVLLAGMVTAKQPPIITQSDFGGMPEFWSFARQPRPFEKLVDGGLPGDLAERKEDARRYEIDRLRQPRSAERKFVTCGLIIRGRAMADGRDGAVRQL